MTAYGRVTNSFDVENLVVHYTSFYRILVGVDIPAIVTEVGDVQTMLGVMKFVLPEKIVATEIIKMQLSFRYNHAVDANRIRFLKYDGEEPTGDSSFLNSLSNTELATVDIISTDVTRVIVTLADVDFFYYQTFIKITSGANSIIRFSIDRDPEFAGTSGYVEIGGSHLVGGTNEWRAATGSEPYNDPVLIISYVIEDEARPQLDMKYTSLDPTSNQSNPDSSIGSYVALNNIYSHSLIGDWINASQNTIPIDAASSLPSPGLGSVGPEVFLSEAIDESEHDIIKVNRGSVLPSFPAGFNSFKVPERVYDLSDVNLLFNTRPSKALTQYRCIAVINNDTENNFDIKDVVIGVIQDSLSHNQITIGVEYPKSDSRRGTAEDWVHSTSSTLLVDSSFTEESGYFDGVAIKFINPTDYAIVQSFAGGEFILDRSVSGLLSGREFVILPAPCQRIANEVTAPSTTSGRFKGFDNSAGGIFIELLEHGTTMQEYDLFYVWIKRVLTANVKPSSDTGAVLILRYKDA